MIALLDFGDHVWHSFCGIPPTPQDGLALPGRWGVSWDWTMQKQARSPHHPCLAEWDCRELGRAPPTWVSPAGTQDTKQTEGS